MALHAEIRREFAQVFGDRAHFDEPLAPHVAYRIGGPADVLVFPQNEGELDWLAAAARRHDLPLSRIGTGTNLLVLDGGIRGIVISLARGFRTIEIRERTDAYTVVECGAGVEKPEFLRWAIAQGLTGLEFSAGVPGTLGGGIFMNAGTKYGCYADILESLRLYDFGPGARTALRQNLYFGYREQHAVGESLVLSATFRLRPGDRDAIAAEVERIIAERAEKQPLDFPSCGSTFKNPTGHSAGRLIERSGLKGLTVGGAVISEKHANFFLNRRQASARDVLTLIELAQATVRDRFQVDLEREVIVIGEPHE